MLRVNFAYFEVFRAKVAKIARRIVLRFNVSAKVGGETESCFTSRTFVRFVAEFYHVLLQFLVATCKISTIEFIDYRL